MIDVDRLLRLRLVVARHGEMDNAGWWNTNGMLGRYGEIALARGLPRTHRFARARVVFAVARSRCQELFDAPASVTLWKLPAYVEDQFDEQWRNWLGAQDEWIPFLDGLADYGQIDLLSALGDRGLISEEEVAAVEALRRSAEGRAVQIPGERRFNDGLITLLAGGFAKGQHAALAVPHARLVA